MIGESIFILSLQEKVQMIPKVKNVSLFKTNTPKQIVYGTRKKLSKPKSKNIRYHFILKEKK